MNSLSQKDIEQLDSSAAQKLLWKIVKNAEIIDEELPDASILLKENFVEGLYNTDFLAEKDVTGTGDMDVSRQALRVLMADDVYKQFFGGFTEPKPEIPKNYLTDPISIISATSLALMVLSTYVHIKRDKDGKWTFEFKIMPASNKLKLELISLIKKITSVLPDHH